MNSKAACNEVAIVGCTVWRWAAHCELHLFGNHSLGAESRWWSMVRKAAMECVKRSREASKLATAALLALLAALMQAQLVARRFRPRTATISSGQALAVTRARLWCAQLYASLARHGKSSASPQHSHPRSGKYALHFKNEHSSFWVKTDHVGF